MRWECIVVAVAFVLFCTMFPSFLFVMHGNYSTIEIELILCRKLFFFLFEKYLDTSLNTKREKKTNERMNKKNGLFTL